MIKTKYPGVYYRVSEGEKMNGRKPDVCFYFNYRKNGELKWKRLGWESEGIGEKVASQERNEYLRCIRLNLPLPDEQIKVPTFAVMFKQYLAWAKENKADPRNDESRYNNHLKGALGRKKLNEISPFTLEHLKSTLLKKGLSGATVKHCLVLVRQVINKAVQWKKYDGNNPVRGVKLPQLNNRRERFLSHEEAGELLAELKETSKRVHDMALISLHTGMRAGEIFDLKIRDLDFQNDLIRVMDPKNKANRTTYMTQAVKEVLEKRLTDNSGDLIFKDRWHGERIGEISRTFERAVEKLGFNNGVEDARHRVVFHTLRHTFGSWLAIQGTPILAIKELMGHKTLAMTERYAHLTPDVKKEATRALESSFNESRDGEKKVVPFEKGSN